jgi:dextranase
MPKQRTRANQIANVSGIGYRGPTVHFVPKAAKGDTALMTVKDLTLDRAAYMPGSLVLLTGTVTGGNGCALSATLYHLHEPVLSLAKRDMPCGPFSFSFTCPDADFTGYLIVVSAAGDTGASRASIGLDVSSRWTRFPRYGYLWDFTQGADVAGKLEHMTRFHINGIQYYDWQYRHHIPLSPDKSSWRDWSGRTIDGDVLRQYIACSHKKNMVSMAYNMIYAANLTYLGDGSGVDASWRLLKANGSGFTCEMSRDRGDTGILQFMNPLSAQWQAYIFSREIKALEELGFDGWHGDTIGEMGPMTAADGGPLGYGADGSPIFRVMDCYTQFLNAAKAALGGKYLSFNPVGAQGIENVSVSDVDVLYAEAWPWDKNPEGESYATYHALHKMIRRAASSSGKSLVVAGYINYRAPGERFNPAAVLLMDAVCFASGGSRIELGNGGRMLSDEYFPNDSAKTMDDTLTADVTRMYDFIVAYQNILRGGQTPFYPAVTVTGAAASMDGRPDTVWTFASADDEWQIVHFINLTGTDNAWRDETQTKKTPVRLFSLKVRIYCPGGIRELYMASPDSENLLPISLGFSNGWDEQGGYAEFVLPELVYWDMIFMR